MPIAVVGNQAHLHFDWPSAEDEDATVTDLAAAGVKVAITEMDIDVLPEWLRTPPMSQLNVKADPKTNPYAKGLPLAKQQALAKRYADLFAVYWKHRDLDEPRNALGRDRWRVLAQRLAGQGRTSYPLLFDRNGKPKLAFDAVVAVPSR